MTNKTPLSATIDYKDLKTHADQIKTILKNQSIQEITPQFLQKTQENTEVIAGLLTSGDTSEWELINNLHEALLTVAFDLITQEVIGEDIVERFVAQLQNPRNTAVLVDRIADPNRFLPEADKFVDEKIQKSWEKYVIEQLENEITDNFSLIKNMSPYTNQEDAKRSKEYVEDLIENSELKTKILMIIDQKFVEGLSPDVAEYIEGVQTNIRKAIQEKNINYSIEQHRKEYNKICDELEKIIPIEMRDISKEREVFAEMMDHLTKDLIEAVVNGPFAQDLQQCTSLADITKLKSSKLYQNITKQIGTIENETIQHEAQDILDEAIKSMIGEFNSSLPKIKTDGDMVNFDGFVFPIFKSKPIQKKKPSRQLEPKISGDNVILNFKERHTGKMIIPSDSKRLRLDNPLEISRTEYTKLQKDLKEVQQKIKNGESVEIPHVIKLVNRLNNLGLPSTDEDLAKNLGKIPSMSDKIKITPDAMTTIKKIIKSCEAQLIRGEGITIIEGEAGVGKNVNIDVIGHYTNRPVFTFACSPKTDREDITYLWTLDEKGTKKLNSLVYEAIRTPGALLVFDEINTLDEGVAKQLNALFDYRRSLKMAHVNGPEQAEQGVILMGTMNPTTYAGTKPLPQDVASRAEIISQDYESLFEIKEGILTTNCSEMIKMTSNIPYFWKLLPNISRSEVKEREKLILQKESGHEISPEEQQKIISLSKKKMADDALLEIWNAINSGDQQAIDKYPSNVVEGLKDIYELLVYANYVRIAYKANKEGWENVDRQYGEVLFNTSVSPRLLYQMLHNIHHGMSARESFFDVYLGQIPDIQERSKIKNFLKNKTLENIETDVKDFVEKSDLLDEQNNNE